MGEFSGKAAIITGAARGIGLTCAKRLMEQGCNVTLADINPEVLESAKTLGAEIKSAKCMGVITNVAIAAEVDALVEKTVQEFGQIDIMFNNAGVNQAMCEVADIEDSVFDKVININLRGVFNGSRAAVRQMIKQGTGGHIVNTGSYYAKRGYGYFAVYCASKAAILNFTRSFAYEAIKHNIFVNAICPGNMYTEMHIQSLYEEAEIENVSFEETREKYRKAIPVQRHGTGDDIANALLFLCSKSSGYTIGEALNVSGGLEMC